MSKIFDALRKAEKESDLLQWPQETTVAPKEPKPPRHLRRLESEFGYLSNSLQSCFPHSRAGRVVQVVGCVQREGATYVASNLARVLARSGGMPVLYLDGDFHNPSLEREFHTPHHLGITDVYTNGSPRDLSSIIQVGDTDQLYVMRTGERRIAPAAFYSGPEFAGIMSSLRRAFRFIIIDAPPLLKYPDSIHLASRADGVVMVVRHKHLKREVIRKGIEMIEGANTPILGAVLNRRKFAIPDLIYRIVS